MPSRLVFEISLTFREAGPVWHMGGWSSNNCPLGFKYKIDLLGIAINRFTATAGETRLGKLFNSSENINKNRYIINIRYKK